MFETIFDKMSPEEKEKAMDILGTSMKKLASDQLTSSGKEEDRIRLDAAQEVINNTLTFLSEQEDIHVIAYTLCILLEIGDRIGDILPYLRDKQVKMIIKNIFGDFFEGVDNPFSLPDDHSL
jgi:hypothetical protein